MKHQLNIISKLITFYLFFYFYSIVDCFYSITYYSHDEPFSYKYTTRSTFIDHIFLKGYHPSINQHLITVIILKTFDAAIYFISANTEWNKLSGSKFYFRAASRFIQSFLLSWRCLQKKLIEIKLAAGTTTEWR